MRVVFFGTPAVAVASLDALVAADDIEVVAVVTNPDRPRGRGRASGAPAVKEAALRHGLEVWQPQRPVEVVAALADLDLDAGAVVAYGALLPDAVLAAGGRGLVNLHFSLLPRWRGAAPVQHAIRAGDAVTGVTTFVLDAGMDTGPVLDQVEEPIAPDDTAGTLLDRLATIGAPVLAASLRRLVAGEQPRPQPAAGVTLAPKVTSDDVRIDWDRAARTVVDLVRSANPAPGAHTTFRGGRLKVWRAAVTDLDADAAADAEVRAVARPGMVVAARHGVTVAVADGFVRLAEVQPQGKARMDGAAFANGHRPGAGSEVLGA